MLATCSGPCGERVELATMQVVDGNAYYCPDCLACWRAALAGCGVPEREPDEASKERER